MPLNPIDNPMDDELIYTPEHLFCDDPICPCHETEEKIYYTVLDQPGYPVQFLLNGEIGIYGGGLDPEEAFDHPSEASQEFQAAYHDQGECEYLEEEDFNEIASLGLDALTFNEDGNLSDPSFWEVEL